MFLLLEVGSCEPVRAFSTLEKAHEFIVNNFEGATFEGLNGYTNIITKKVEDSKYFNPYTSIDSIEEIIDCLGYFCFEKEEEDDTVMFSLEPVPLDKEEDTRERRN